MFTGLIEEVGHVRRVDKVKTGLQRLEVEARVVTDGLQLGDSVNINGACQTVVQVGTDRFSVESVSETLQRTTLGSLRVGDPVNLEVDVVARYVERLLTSDPNAPRKRLELEDLRRLGYSED